MAREIRDIAHFAAHPGSRARCLLNSDDLTVIITATNRFFTEPIAAELGVAHLIATEPEMREENSPGNVPAPVSAKAKSIA